MNSLFDMANQANQRAMQSGQHQQRMMQQDQQIRQSLQRDQETMRRCEQQNRDTQRRNEEMRRNQEIRRNAERFRATHARAQRRRVQNYVSAQQLTARSPAPGWYADPWRAALMRWWDGSEWTDSTLS